MLPKDLFRLCAIIWAIFLCTAQASNAQAEEKSSLSFVVDNTASMWQEINAVKISVKDIFDTVINSNKSHIEDFVLTTFRDPGVQHRITTRDSIAFKRAVEEIALEGNWDCPEMSMSGIKMGLEHSRPGSLMYVFTDASSKDPQYYGEVKKLAQKKQIQVVFGLTGNCTIDFPDHIPGNETVYFMLAKATGGQVFNIMKSDVPDLISYVKTQISDPKPTIVNEDFPAGTHNVAFRVDSKMKELVISISGPDYKVKLTDPDGGTPPIEVLKEKKTFTFLKIAEVKSGTYTAEVSSSGRNSIKVTAETTVHFRHGFSLTMPTSLKETVTRPIPGEPSYLSIKLETGDTKDIVLDKVQLLDLENNVLVENPLKLVNDKDQFYVSKSTLIPPNQLLRVAIKGHDINNEEIITRISLTPVEPQSKDDIPTTNKIPTVDLIGENFINAEYNESLSLKCKVSGYPKPKVIWQSNDGTVLDSTTHLVEYPYDYLSTLSISKVISNATYYCIARNDYGGDSKQVQVQTIRKRYYNILKKPISATIELNNKAVFECEVGAYPPAKNIWYKDERKITEDSNVNVSGNQLLINQMLPSNVGIYSCQASNEDTRHEFQFHVKISGIEPPKIDKTITEIRVRDGENVEIPCNVIQGKPKPSIRWSYKDGQGEEYSIEESNDSEKISLTGVTRDEMSYRSYRCIADNGVGSADYNRIDLIIEYPPRMYDEGETETVEAKVGDKVIMDCDVEGEPTPTVKWFLNGKELVLTARHGRGYYGFNFLATEEDAGSYVCEATNKLGTVKKTTELRVYRPAEIQVPEESSLSVMVGNRLELPCQASGYPDPVLQWNYFSLNPKIRQKTLSSGDDGTLTLERLQMKDEGFYTCIASNLAGAYNITYTVTVLAPPNIENKLSDKTFTAVEKDRVLRIPCYATGNPKPEISWLKEGVDKIATGTDWYDIDEDGALIIKDLDQYSAGMYVCEAHNRFGNDTEFYEVIVEESPSLRTPTKTINLVEGNSTELNCNVPHRDIDYFRWFKDGREISRANRHHLIKANPSDAGIYVCRVSDFAKSRSGFTQVNIEYAPRFRGEHEENIDFVEGVTAVLDCTADAYPPAQVFWWYEHNSKRLPVKTMKYEVDMNSSSKGLYFCSVENKVGKKYRRFDIAAPEECLLDIKSELTENHPLILSPYMTWPTLETNDGRIRITPKDTILLACSSKIRNLNKNEVMVSCNRNHFNVDGRNYKFSDLQCESRFIPVARRTNENCLNSNINSKTVRIGYEVSGTFFEVFEVCLDMETRVPLYAKHRINHALANVEPNVKRWQRTELVPYNADDLYNCNSQISRISSLLRHWFHREDKCCFSRRLLVNPRDLLPGLPQMTTYTNLNVVPHWSSCNSENWESIEDRIRTLTKSSSNDLLVWTGTAEQLQISSKNISIYDYRGRHQPVPEYVWKVVQDPTTRASLAIVQLNIPDVTVAEAHSHLLCRDMCQEVSWMRSEHWSDVSKGFTFCCNILEFEQVLGYDNVFNSRTGKVLYDVHS